MKLPRLLLVLPVFCLLAACASGPAVLEAEVQSIATSAGTAGQPLRRGLRYRFERLPLAAQQPGNEQLETLAERALANAGLSRDDAHADITVQVDSQTYTYWVDEWGTPWPNRWGGMNPRIAFMLGAGYGRGFYLGAPLWWDDMLPQQAREIRLLMRDARSGQLLYETHARHDGFAGRHSRTTAALLAAALQDFPHPPAGWRTVAVPLSPPAGDTANAPAAAQPLPTPAR